MHLLPYEYAFRGSTGVGGGGGGGGGADVVVKEKLLYAVKVFTVSHDPVQVPCYIQSRLLEPQLVIAKTI